MADKVLKISVAPMMAWTDRHCRYLLRLCAPDIRLFTEMVTSGALLHGPAERLLRFDVSEHPVVMQLGGSDPAELAKAAVMAESAGYDEINLNVGCPSARVQQGRFGACLMREPQLVAELVGSMQQAVDIDVSIKCRLGVDEADSQPLLENFISQSAAAGVRRFYVHARKAILGGLSPAQNRKVPPLQAERVYALKQRFPQLEIHFNGEIRDIETATAHSQHVDGIMIGREAYQRPLFLTELAEVFHQQPVVDVWNVMQRYLDYIERETASGTRLHDMTRHCLGIFSGFRGARQFRQLLSDNRRLKANDPRLVAEAIDCVQQLAA